MNDPLKKIINRYRDEFDDLEPSPDLFFKITAELKKDNSADKKSIVRLAFSKKWLIAASILIALFSGYLMFKTTNTEMVVKKNQTVVKKKSNQNIGSSATDKSAFAKDHELAIATKINTSRKLSRVTSSEKKTIDMSTVYRDLTDSSSSSTRLAAILKIESSGIMSYDIIDRLAKTLDVDGNTNVRLAALTLMGKYTQDAYVNDILLKALDTQKNPSAQLGLIEALSRTDNPKLAGKLQELTNDPNTFLAVKDQAYLVLLNHNKL